jgi:hypothetical protein
MKAGKFGQRQRCTSRSSYIRKDLEFRQFPAGHVSGRIRIVTPVDTADDVT